MYLWGEPVTRSGGRGDVKELAAHRQYQKLPPRSGRGDVRELAAHRQYLKLPPRGGRGAVREAGAYSAIFRHKVAFSS